MKIVFYTAMITIAFFISGCGTLKPPTPAQIEKNKNIKVYINESADIARSKAFIDAYIKVLNDGFETEHYYTMNECSLVPIKPDMLRWRKDRKFYTTYNGNYLITWKGSKLSKDKIKLSMKAKKISDNSIEIETDGTLCDIASKQISLKTVGFYEKAFKKLLPYGYMDFNIDTLALKDNRLVLNFYSKYVNIKDVYSKQLKNRGYTIVDNYKDADRAIFIENIMALPKTFSGRLINYYKRNHENYLMNEVANINNIVNKTYEINGNSASSTDELSRLASLHATTGGGGLVGIETSLFVAGAVIDMFGPKDRDITSLGYKIIIENKQYNKDSSSAIDKYRYRAAIYTNSDLLAHSSVVWIRDYLQKNKYEQTAFTYDIVNYFDNDETNLKTYLYKADYDDINKEYL